MEKLAAIHARIAQLRPQDADMLAAFIDILEAHSGSTSPEEEFIHSLVIAYKHGPSGLDPEWAASLLREFEENMLSVAAAAHHFARRHPEACHA